MALGSRAHIVRWQVATLALALCSAQPVALAAPVTTSSVQIDGSGTSNVAPIVWQVIEILKSRIKPATFFSYRSVGTGAGQSDFLSNSNADATMFAFGDVGLNDTQQTMAKTQGNKALTIPLGVASVSVFVSFPGLASGQLRLSPCTLAKIFTGAITTWGNVDIIKDVNASSLDVDLLPGKDQPIQVLRRGSSSSSTYALTKYLNLAVADPACWNDVTEHPPGLQVPYFAPDASGNLAAATSQDMVSKLLVMPFAIGYVESKLGLDAGLAEVPLLNKDGQFVATSDSDAVIVPANLGNALPTTLDSSKWAEADLVFQNGNKVFPMSLISVMYLRQNLTAQGTAGFLTQYLAQFMLSDEVAALLPMYGFHALDKTTRINFARQLNLSNMVIIATGTNWKVEGATALDDGQGQADYVISANRDSHVLSTLKTLQSDMAANKNALTLGGAYQVHGGGFSQAADYIRAILARLQSQSRAPIQATYREVDTAQAQQEFALWQQSIANLNGFKVGDIPLDKTTLTAFSSGSVPYGPALHLPISAGSISVFYNQQVPSFALQLSPCLLARIYTGDVVRWSNVDLARYNGYEAQLSQLPFLNKPIMMFAYQGSSSTARVLATWLSKACPSRLPVGFNTSAPTWSTAVSTTYNQLNITTPELMAQAIQNTPNSIGFMYTNHGVAAGLNEAYLENDAGHQVSASDDDAPCSIINTIQTVVAAAGNKVPLVARDTKWSAVDFTGASNPDACPMTTVIYGYLLSSLAGYGTSGPLIKALFEYIYSREGQSKLSDYGLTPLPESLRRLGEEGIKTVTVAPQLGEWTFEDKSNPGVTGMSLQSFSPLRVSATQAAINALADNVTKLQARVDTGLVLRVAGPSTGELLTLGYSSLHSLSAFATCPLRVVYEDVSTGIETLYRMLAPNQDLIKTRVLLLDQPLSTVQWRDLADKGTQPLQMPLAIRPLALVYSTGVNTSVVATSALPSVRLSACNLGNILAGKITMWDDPALVADNQNLGLPSRAIKLYAACSGATCGSLQAVLAYVRGACNSVVLDSASLAPINTMFKGGDLMQQVVNAGGYSALALASPYWANQFSFLGTKEAALRATDKQTWVVATQMTADSFSYLLQSRLELDPRLRDVWADWSDFNLSSVMPPAGQPPAYPLARVDFLVAPADLSDTGELGGPIMGFLEYVYSIWQSGGVAPLFPDVAPLPSLVSNEMRSGALTLMRLAAGVAAWPVVASSSNITGSQRAFVMSYSSWSSLASSSSGDGISALVNTAVHQALASAQAAASQSSDNESNNQTTWGLAVAALVLALVLALAGLVMASLALYRTNRVLHQLRNGQAVQLAGSAGLGNSSPGGPPGKAIISCGGGGCTSMAYEPLMTQPVPPAVQSKSSPTTSPMANMA